MSTFLPHIVTQSPFLGYFSWRKGQPDIDAATSENYKKIFKDSNRGEKFGKKIWSFIKGYYLLHGDYRDNYGIYTGSLSHKQSDRSADSLFVEAERHC